MDYQIYIENKYDLDKCNTSYLRGWKFFIPKTVCKACFLGIINMEHLFGNLKNIFCDVDCFKTMQSTHRNRTNLNSKLRRSRSIRRNHINKNNENNEIETKGKKKKLLYKKGTKIRIRNFGYFKDNHNNLYDDKKGLLTNNKDIIKENNSIKSKNNNINSDSKKNLNGQTDEKSVTEIKIETNEFLGEVNLLKNKNNENKKNDKNSKNSNNNNNKSHSEINNDLLNKLLMNKFNNNFISKQAKEIKSNEGNKNKITMNIYSEILNANSMSNKIVLKLTYKLNKLREILIYLIINVGDFRDKLYNTMNINPSIVPFGVSLFEFYFNNLYNEIFKARKEYEEIFMEIKNQSIPSIKRNISLLKEQEKLEEEENKNLDDMIKSLNEFIPEIDGLEGKYEEAMKNIFEHFKFFFSLMDTFKIPFG